jgi:hypothetical protein
MSLVDPILPPGYRFALIDADCNVLFHSDSYRNMREDFCENSKDKDELRPWFFSGVDTPLDISYGGRTERAYLTSLEFPHFALEGSAAGSNTTQVFLLVFQEPELSVTLNLAVVLVCSILMGAYLVIVLLAGTGYLLVRRALRSVYMPQFLFPQRKHAFAYLQIFISNVVILLLFSELYPRLYEAPLLTLTFSVAVVSILLVVSSLAFPEWGPLVLGVSLAAIAAFMFISTLTLPPRGPGTPPDWELVTTLLGVASLIAVLLAGRVKNRITQLLPVRAQSWLGDARGFVQKHFNSVAEKHFDKAYVLAMLCVIVAAGLVPCIGFFKYSYDAIAELALKRDEIVLSERLINRRDRISDYYKDVQLCACGRTGDCERQPCVRPGSAESLADQRTSEDLDLAYGGRFTVSDSQPCIPKGVSESRDYPNDMIERAVAKATLTLTLPTNELGAQMSKLGVASSEDQENNWEHFWIECTPTTFQLLWKGSSRWPDRAVTATYPNWQGLPGVQRLLLILLWIGVGFWLAIIVKQIFFVGVADVVSTEDEKWPPTNGIQHNYLIITPSAFGRGRDTEITELHRENLDMRIELKKMVEKKSYRPKIDDNAKVVILDHFDSNIRDPNYNQARLELLESLVCKPGVKLVIISGIDPLYFLTDDAADALAGGDNMLTRRLLLGRWATALSTFTKVRREYSSQSEFRQVSSANQEVSSFSALWTGLSSTERLVLFQLAKDGWANPKSLPAIKQLESKQLIGRKPMYQIIDEGFRRFVLSPEHAEEMALWEKLQQQSTWHAMKFVVITIGIGFAAWLLYSQAAFSQTVVAYIAAIATLITAAGNLFGRSGVSKSPKAEGE